MSVSLPDPPRLAPNPFVRLRLWGTANIFAAAVASVVCRLSLLHVIAIIPCNKHRALKRFDALVPGVKVGAKKSWETLLFLLFICCILFTAFGNLYSASLLRSGQAACFIRLFCCFFIHFFRRFSLQFYFRLDL